MQKKESDDKSHHTSRESVIRTDRQATRILQTNNNNSNPSRTKHVEGPYTNILLLARPSFQQGQMLYSRLTMCLMANEQQQQDNSVTSIR